MDINTLTLLGTVGTSIAGMFGGIWAVKKYILKPIYSIWVEHLSRLKKLDTIYYELQPNGGKSLKDQINKLSISMVRLHTRMTALYAYNEQPVFESDSSGKCLWINRAYCRMIGSTPEEVYGNGWRNYILPEDLKEVSEKWDEAIKDQRDFKMSYKMVSSQGRIINCTCEAFVIRDDDGKLQNLGYIGFISRQDKNLEKSL